MAGLRYPRSVWSFQASALVAAAILTPLVGTLLLAQDLRTVSGVATTTQLVVLPIILGASIVLYVQYRLTGSSVVAWLTMCLTLYAVQGVMLAGLRAGEPDQFFRRPGWVLVIDLPVAVLILVAVRMASRVRLPVDPLSSGLLLGLLVAGVNLAANTLGPELTMTSPPAVVAMVLLAVVGFAIGLTAYRIDEIPRWCALRLGLGTLALVANRLASLENDSAAVGSVAVVTGVLGAVLMVNAAGAGLRAAIQENRRSLATLTDQVAAMEADERDSRARLHEITNSIASIAVASTLIHGSGDVPPSKRQKLAKMVESESCRLARVLTNPATLRNTVPGEESTASTSDAAPRVVDLDEVIRPLVTSQQALHHFVDWEPSGQRAVGDSDTVAEVLNILLDNSARHAPGSHTSIQVQRRGDMVEIAVRDDGPGVPPEIRSTMFEWGGRGPNSRGQGIGLHLASRLMTSEGNTLRLETDQAGTSFVVSLPAAAETRS
ncbi:MAG: sensor histidine kinase [Actinomycetota bacterium]|nr:sensor histidine kinase [Actinomycetota bacterium]